MFVTIACLRRPLLCAAVSLLMVGGGQAQASSTSDTAKPTLTGDEAHPDQARGWVETQLFFGLRTAGAAGGVSERAWQRFLDTEVTPRFPAGLSVMDVYGQWQNKVAARGKARVSHLRSKMLLITYPPSAENAARVEAIRAAWKTRTGDQSVLKITQPVDVSF